MLKVGIIGLGKISQLRHLPEYEENPDAQIAAVYDMNAERTAEIAKKYNSVAYDSYEAILADPEIDAVSVCTTNTSHADIVVAALKAGKHVLCEKPMATTVEDCERMVKVAEETGKVLMIGQNQRITQAHSKARELVANGALGRIISFRTSFSHCGPESWSVDGATNTWFFDKNRAVMGAIADLGVHKTDLIQYLTGLTITEVTAHVTTLDKKNPDGSPIPVDDNAFCIYRMSNGAVGTLHVSWTNYFSPEENATVLYGSDAVLRIYDDPRHTLILHKNNGETEYYDYDAIQTNDNQTKSDVIDMFVNYLLGRSDYCISAQSVLPAMRAVFGALESSATGRAVKVNC